MIATVTPMTEQPTPCPMQASKSLHIHVNQYNFRIRNSTEHLVEKARRINGGLSGKLTLQVEDAQPHIRPQRNSHRIMTITVGMG